MPTYDYTCEANGRTVEVMHAMSVTLKTWGQVCEEGELDLGGTPPDGRCPRVWVWAQLLRATRVLSLEDRAVLPARVIPIENQLRAPAWISVGLLDPDVAEGHFIAVTAEADVACLLTEPWMVSSVDRLAFRRHIIKVNIQDGGAV